jgi:putative transcriptional regulator
MTVIETAEFLRKAQAAAIGISARGVAPTLGGEGIGGPKMVVRKKTRAAKKAGVRNRQTVGESIIKGLNEAIAWTRGENNNVRVTLIQIPEVDVRTVRAKMGLSQAEFATKFGLPPATLRNWEQGRSRPDAPTRVLLAVIAKHPEAVEDVLRRAS